VGINPAVTNRDCEFFGRDADRWLPREREATKSYEERVQHVRDVAEFTLGAGKKGVHGKVMTRLELYKLFVTLYSLYGVSKFH